MADPVSFRFADGEQSLILGTPETVSPDGRDFWTEESMFALDRTGMPVPRFTVSEAAKMFFGNSTHWLRWRLKSDPAAGHPDGYFILDGKAMTFRRTESGARYFTLADIERMGHALAQQRLIPGSKLRDIILAVKAVARLHDVGI
jgi:hypothetical protein